MLLHNWYYAKVKWGKSEPNEVCAGCRKYMPVNTTCLVLRVAMDDSKRLFGPIIELWCETCALLMYPKVFAGMEGPIRVDNVGEFGEHSSKAKWEWVKIPRLLY